MASAAQQAVTVEQVAPGVVLATFNRPRVLHAFNAALYDGLRDCIYAFSSNPDQSILVITGSGPYFSSGADLTDIVSPEDGFLPLARAFSACPKLIIAAVNGPAIGVGLTLITHCDLVFASETATFMAPFLSLGLVPEFCSSWTLPTTLGPALAHDVLFAERKLTAQEALLHGLVSRVISAPASVKDEAINVAKGILAKPLAAESIPIFKKLLQGPRKAILQKAFDDEFKELMTRFTNGDPFRAAMQRNHLKPGKLFLRVIVTSATQTDHKTCPVCFAGKTPSVEPKL
jgi:enoyl-CoA hydratase/carnithine racemase